MAKILFVNACVRENSRTLELAESVMNLLEGERVDVDLYKSKIVPLDVKGMKTREIANSKNDFSDDSFEFAKQFAQADTIVIAAPYWDLMFPSVLKIYFEAVTVNGLTFTYGENGIPRGLCKAERLIYVTTSGGPIVMNFGYDYVSALAKYFYGIKDVKCISAEKLDIHRADVEKILRNAKESITL